MRLTVPSCGKVNVLVKLQWTVPPSEHFDCLLNWAQMNQWAKNFQLRFSVPQGTRGGWGSQFVQSKHNFDICEVDGLSLSNPSFTNCPQRCLTLRTLVRVSEGKHKLQRQRVFEFWKKTPSTIISLALDMFDKWRFPALRDSSQPVVAARGPWWRIAETGGGRFARP